MSTIDLPPGVQHGTPEGHLAGCKGEHTDCPALTEHGMSCTYAYVRSTTTPDRYYKAKAHNPEPREIARTLGFTPTTHTAALAAVHEANATLPPRNRKPAPPRERTTPMPDPQPSAQAPVDEVPETVDAGAAQAPAAEKMSRPSTAQIRDWAKGAGMTVPTHGPIPKPVATAYDLAHGLTPTPETPAADAPTPPATLTMADFTHGLSQAATRERGRQIRAWARTHGYPDLADRGIVPPAALYAYLLEHPGATDPAQPLAEQSHDPRSNTPAPADGAAAAPAESTDAEGEDMGHTPATEELIDQVRERIDMPKPAPPAILTDVPGPRPEWADVTTSNDVAAALEQRDQARSLAARLWDQLEAAEHRAHTAETALELTLTHWNHTTQALAAARRANSILLARLDQLRAHRDEGWVRAYRATRALDEIRDAAAAHPGSTVTVLPEEDGQRGIRLNPPTLLAVSDETTTTPRRRSWWGKGSR